MTRKWKHDELQHDLAQHLCSVSDRLVWENMQMGPSGSPRPDVWTLCKSYSKPMPAAYEIKISRADFLSDCNAAKWQSYLPFSAGIYFAVPEGLVKKTEVPEGCGLIVRGENTWTALKAPRWGRYTLSADVMMKLLIDGIDRNNRNLSARRTSEYQFEMGIRVKLGERVARAVTDMAQFENQIETLKGERDKLRTEVHESLAATKKRLQDEQQREIAQAQATILRGLEPLRKMLGLPDTCTAWDMTRELSRAARRIDRDAEIHHLRQKLESIRHVFHEVEKIKFVPVKKQETTAR